LSIGFLLAHLIGLATVFENPTSYLYFFVFLGFVAYMVKEVRIGTKVEVVEVKDNKKSSEQRASHVLVGVIVVVSFVFLFITNINPARANKATTRAMQQVYSGTATADVYTEPLLYGSPHSDDIRNDISRSVIEIINTLVQNKKTENLASLLTAAIDELKKNRLLHPRDIRVNYTLYTLYDYAYQLTGDKTLLAASEKEIKDALLLSPKRQQFEYALAQIMIQQQKFDEAKKIIETSVHNDEVIGEGWFRLAALTLQQSNNKEEAQKIIDEAVEKNAIFTETHIQTLQSVGLVVKK
jgi:tetratricopeptide (TPR) repeat protein